MLKKHNKTFTKIIISTNLIIDLGGLLINPPSTSTTSPPFYKLPNDLGMRL
jgi:hypothetical protein